MKKIYVLFLVVVLIVIVGVARNKKTSTNAVAPVLTEIAVVDYGTVQQTKVFRGVIMKNRPASLSGATAIVLVESPKDNLELLFSEFPVILRDSSGPIGRNTVEERSKSMGGLEIYFQLVGGSKNSPFPKTIDSCSMGKELLYILEPNHPNIVNPKK